MTMPIQTTESNPIHLGRPKKVRISRSLPRITPKRPRISERQSSLASDVVIGKGGRRHIRLY